ncbi:MAG: hypothetical protein A2W27_02970 [Deltaproteobacteria bacterium RBG_16_44_11]|nr:MAG: hypothetical protein A2W27_02970 [Deltaproteobacteria bacterium RBG_16_44_11]
MNITDKINRQLLTKILIAIISAAIMVFYILSACGWFMATYYMGRTGLLGNEMTTFYESLNILDHIVRIAQVILIVVASILLLFSRKLALKLLLVSTAFSLLTFLFISKWGISFLGGGLLFLIPIYGYAYFLYRKGFLH